MPGGINLHTDPFVSAAGPMQSGGYGAANAAPGTRSSINLRSDPFLSGTQRGPQLPTGPGHQNGDILEITIRRAEGLPRSEASKAGTTKPMPVCIASITGKPATMIRTEACSNRSSTDPVWGREPEYFRAHLEGWAPGDTLSFTIQEEATATSKVIAVKDLTFPEYKNGYEWWMPLQVAKMKEYPLGWPYAALQVKVELVHGIRLTTADPFMSSEPVLGKGKTTGMRNCCWNCCLPCRMWCCRRLRVCSLCCWLNCKWCSVMSGLGCWFGCLECCSLWDMFWSWCMGRESLNDLRRSCAKRFKLPDAGVDDEGDIDIACCCVPLRTAVFAISVLSTINAIVTFFFPRWLSDSDQVAGGYSMSSRVVVGATQVTGLFFGPIGCLGAYDLNVSLLKTYNLYQMLRLCGMVYMMYTDVPLLINCDQWRVSLDSAIKEYGWNPAMYNVALGNSCLQAQLNFVFAAIFSFVIYTYLVSLTRRLIWDTEQTPRYLLAMPRDAPNGAFVKHDRTQGKSKPPYGAVLGDAIPMGPRGLLAISDQGNSRAYQPGALVGPPVSAHDMMPPGTGDFVGGPGMKKAQKKLSFQY